MMKRFTVLTVFALLLAFGVGQAMAGSITNWPVSMNNTWTVFGMTSNASRTAGQGYIGIINSSTVGDKNSNFKTYMTGYRQSLGNMSANATIMISKNLPGGAADNYTSTGGTSQVYIDQANGPSGYPRSLLYLNMNTTSLPGRSGNGTMRLYMVPTSGYTAAFGLASRSINGSRLSNASNAIDGFTFLTMQPQNTLASSGTPLAANRYNFGGANGLANSSTWAFFTMGPGTLSAGKIVFNRSNGNAYVYALNNSVTPVIGNYTTQLSTYAFGVRKGTSSLIENATLALSNSSFFGESSNNTKLTIGLKDAIEGSASDWVSKTYNVVGVGFTKLNQTIATLGTISTDASSNFAYGNLTVYNKTAATQLGYTTIRPGGSAKVTYSRATKLFGVPLYSRTGGMDNITIYNSTGYTTSYLTLWEKNKKFGVGYSQESSASSKGSIVIFVPATPTLGAINGVSMAGVSAMGGSKNITINTPSLQSFTWAAEKKRYATTLTDTNFRPFGDARRFNATFTCSDTGAGTQHAANYTAFNYSFTGWGGPVANLGLYKLIRRVGKDYSAEATNATRQFSYANDGFGQSDGRWWVSTDAAGLNVLLSSQTLNPQSVYYVNFIVKDNNKATAGGYDGNYTAKFVTDPQVFGENLIVAGTGSSSSTGCVFNPTAGFGLEWLLLLIAPALGIIRSRIKK